jgi:glutathione S-transferase
VISGSIARCTRYFQLLGRVLEDRKILCGDRLSPADIPVGTTLYRYFELETDRQPCRMWKPGIGGCNSGQPIGSM